MSHGILLKTHSWQGIIFLFPLPLPPPQVPKHPVPFGTVKKYLDIRLNTIAMRSLFLSFFLIGSLFAQPGSGFAGTWNGKLQFPGQQLRLVLHLELDEEGAWKASLDSPDQGAFGMPADSVRISGDSVLVTMTDIRAEYAGVKKGETIQGTFSQGGMRFKLELGREAIAGPARPQTPQPPFPYREDSVVFFSGPDSIRLAGTLTLPEGPGPFPAAILITGSGPQDRNEMLFSHQPFWVIADHFTRQGIAVLRYDERGVGESSGDFSAATSLDFSHDAEAAFDFLLKDARIDSKKIGLVGHSEGGLVAPMVAARRTEVAFAILMAGPGLPGMEVIVGQEAKMLTGRGVSQETIRHWEQTKALAFAWLDKTRGEEDFSDSVDAHAAEILKPLTVSDRMALGVRPDQLGKELGPIASPWFRYFLAYDPIPTLKAVKCPILALNGDKDVQVLPDENMGPIEAVLREQGEPRSLAKRYPELNHLFQTAKTGMPEEYGQIEETIAPEVLADMSAWILGLWK